MRPKEKTVVSPNFYSILESKRRVKETYLHQVSFPDPKYYSPSFHQGVFYRNDMLLYANDVSSGQSLVIYEREQQGSLL